MTTRPKYTNLLEFADAVQARGPHEASVDGSRWLSGEVADQDGSPVVAVWPWKGGAAFTLTQLLFDTRLRESIFRTARARLAAKNR